VVVGESGGGYVEIRRGIAEGDRVVVSANFLIDAESNLKAALDSFGHAGHGATPATEDAVPAREAPPDPADHAGHGGH